MNDTGVKLEDLKTGDQVQPIYRRHQRTLRSLKVLDTEMISPQAYQANQT